MAYNAQGKNVIMGQMRMNKQSEQNPFDAQKAKAQHIINKDKDL